MKKILVMCLVACFAVVGISGVASAATKAGDLYLDGGLSFNAATIEVESEDFDASMFMANVGVEKFFTDSFATEFGILGMAANIDISGDDISLTGIGLQVKPNWHFNTASNVVPYVGLNLGYAWLGTDVEGEDADGNAFIYGAQAGIKQFIKENVCLQYEVSYTMGTLEMEDTDIDIGDLRIGVGIGYKF